MLSFSQEIVDGKTIPGFCPALPNFCFCPLSIPCIELPILSQQRSGMLVYKAPPRQFQPPNWKLTLQKRKDWQPPICSFCKKVIQNSPFSPSHLELEIVLGVLYKKSGDRKRGALRFPSQRWVKPRLLRDKAAISLMSVNENLGWLKGAFSRGCF